MHTAAHADVETVLATARTFARDELRPVALAYDESEEYPRDVLHKAAALGLTCYDLPAEVGGGGLGSLRARCAVIEELTWGDSPIFWVIAQGGFFAGPLLALGTDEQKRRWLPPLTGAEPPACAVAITEPEHGSDSAAIETTARRVDGGYVINGHKRFIGNAPIADVCVVFATVDPSLRSRGITAFVVEHGDEGFVRGERLPKMGSRCFPAGELRFEDCFVADDRRLGGEGEGFSGLMHVFDVARVQLAASSVGLGRAALELGVAHATERHAFGKPIHEFQAVSFRLADAKVKLMEARLLTHHAADLADAGEPFSTEAAMAKLAASEASWFAAQAAVQTLGGAGYVRTSLAQKWLRDAKLDEIWDGTSDIMRLIVARSLFPAEHSMRDPRYDVLFEPVQLGPVTARNRFFQVPHCNGMGHRDPTAHAVMRGVKAEGGWAVVCTEEVEIHPTSDVSGFIEGRLWDDADIPAHERLVYEVHAHGSLAGIELVHNGMASSNLYGRIPPAGPSHLPVKTYDPIQARAMTHGDIGDLRRRHRAAVRRALSAGYDLVYVYAAHNLSTLQHFLSPRANHRDDDYGGTLANRVRLLREVLEDTREECDGRAAVACRLAIDELHGADGIQRGDMDGVFELIGELPDVWDVMVGVWEDDSLPSRFGYEAWTEQHFRGIKELTTKPVVGIGWLTSPDTMVRLVQSGVLDLIGAARPSIADPFLPRKVEEGRLEDIRECIGCNICVTGDWTMTPIRCTQNPSMGEEWRRGWHPERFRPRGSDAKVLVVGGGPAGMEAAMALGKRGYDVMLAEASRELGGRVLREARLPGLAPWIRVVDYRRGQLAKLPNVVLALESEVTADEVHEYGFDHVAVATGARWRADGVGRWHTHPIPLDLLDVLTPDDIFAGTRPAGDRVLVYDDDHYYLGGALAELLAGEGRQVTLVTPAALVSEWTVNTMEQPRIHRRLVEAGVELLPSRALSFVEGGEARLLDTFTDRESTLPLDSLVLVTARLPNDALALELGVTAIGDAHAPGTIATAVWDGRRYAEELDGDDPGDAVPFRREVVQLA